MQATSNPNTARSAIIAGFVLVIIGGAALISQLFPTYDRYIPLIVGLSLAAVFVATRNYAALVGGSIMTGLGIGLLAAQAFPSSAAGGVGATLGLGIGFLSVWVVGKLMVLRQHHFWPLIPGFILTAVGIGLAADVFATQLGDLVLPAVAVALGLLLMIGGLLNSRRTPGPNPAA